jgi:hypothetical protein
MSKRAEGRTVAHVSSLLLCILLAGGPAAAQGVTQASVSGVVTDASGAVLPGVTVEAASPELIEKVRSTVTDATGRYQIIELRPGIYSVTFTLTGFSVIRREGIELAGSFAARVNVELHVGAVSETVTVTGESPIVDIQNPKQSQVLGRDALTSIPTGRLYNSYAALIPGVTPGGNVDVGGLGGAGVRNFSAYGGRVNEGRLLIDGIGVGANSSGTSNYVADPGNAAEIVMSTFGNLGEAEVGGPIMNLVPRTGGNSLSGSFFGTGANGSMQGDNTKALVDSGALRAPNELIKIWDLNGAIGGPLKKDRAWFFVTSRYHGQQQYITNMWFNRNAGNPAAWTYDADLSRRAIDDGTWKNTSLRLTWQATARNKFNAYWDEQRKCDGCIGGGNAMLSPEAETGTNIIIGGDYWRNQQLTWTSPLTNRILLEAGIGQPSSLYGRPRDGANLDLVRVTEQGGLIPGLTYRAMDWQRNHGATLRWRASMSYVTGTHNVKFGIDGERFLQQRQYHNNNQGLLYRFNNGIPNQLTMLVNDFQFENHTRAGAAYIQDQWTTKRLTLAGGLRWDYASSWSPALVLGPLRFIPNQLSFPESEQVRGYRDVNARFGASYDLFGNGKTAVKVTLGRYLDPAQSAGIYTDPSPIRNIGGGTPPSTTRSWTDLNQDYVPDCDLLNKAANGECGPWATQTFGSIFTPTTQYDPRLLEGWGVRGYDWGFGTSIQHEILPRVSVEASYHRRWFGNFLATDNLASGPSDYAPYSITAPIDSRLPGGGGFVIGDQWNISNEKFGQGTSLITTATTYGEQTQYWHGVDFNVKARLQNGVTIQGGTSTGRQVTDTCNVIVDNPSRRSCHVAFPFQSQIKGLALYTIPRIDVQVSAIPEQSGDSPCRESGRAEHRRRPDTRPTAVGRAIKRDDQSPRTEPDVSRSDQRDRSAHRQADSGRPVENQHRDRYLQPDEFRRRAELEHHLRIGVADADAGDARAVCQSQRAVRFLMG